MGSAPSWITSGENNPASSLQTQLKNRKEKSVFTSTQLEMSKMSNFAAGGWGKKPTVNAIMAGFFIKG